MDKWFDLKASLEFNFSYNNVLLFIKNNAIELWQ